MPRNIRRLLSRSGISTESISATRISCGILCTRAAKIGGTPMVVTFQSASAAGPGAEQCASADPDPGSETCDHRVARNSADGCGAVRYATRADRSARDFAVQVLWERLHPKEVYVGPNFAFGHRRQGSFNLLKEIGEEKGFWVGKIHQVQFRGNRVSSTAIRQALVSGQVGLARRLLARPFDLQGVNHSRKRTGYEAGDSNGKPEDVQRTDPSPRHLCDSLLIIDGRKYRSVTNIGFRPTVDPRRRCFFEH